MNEQVSTFTFFRFTGTRNKFWALSQMGIAHSQLKQVNGQAFYKLMGSGKGRGFNPLPDWSVYSLFQVWENEKAAQSFFQDAGIFSEYLAHSEQRWTMFMRATRARGSWSGQSPIEVHSNIDAENKMVVALTRATVKTSKLIPFWNYVPQSQNGLHDHPDLIYSKGVGQYPVTEMATFSIWRDVSSLEQFAYKQRKGHGEGVRRANSNKWFREEMFVRFQPYRFEGEWDAAKL